MTDRPAIRSRKGLAVSSAFTAFQRDWFDGLKGQVAGGAPFALVSADAPHEIFRAMDIPYVVVQWWSSLISAKQAAPHALAALAERGYPDSHQQYNALGFGESFLDEVDRPWGGLPRPSILCAPVTTDGMHKLFEEWASATGAELLLLERTVDCRNDIPVEWWNELSVNWERSMEPARLDLMTDELVDLVDTLERLTGRQLSRDRLSEVMDLVNEQERYFAETRDLIARSVPAPVTIADTMPATMIPQWHRGTEWGRDAARAVRDEVAARVEAGVGAVDDERVRLMWLGRGMWSSMGLYQEFENRHGAVFVWSMYLALAADGYIRETGDDLLRTLAARYVPMGDELRMPTWSSAWHLKEARHHQIDAVISLGEDDYFSIRALEEAGIPVLHIDANNTDRRTWSEAELTDMVGDFIVTRAEPVARRRKKGF